VIDQHFDTGVKQEGSEDVHDPVKSVEQGHAGEYEDGSHHDGTDDAPKQDLVLVFRFNFKETEDQNKDEKVVDAE